jgi:hypothetical protein
MFASATHLQMFASGAAAGGSFGAGSGSVGGEAGQEQAQSGQAQQVKHTLAKHFYNHARTHTHTHTQAHTHTQTQNTKTHAITYTHRCKQTYNLLHTTRTHIDTHMHTHIHTHTHPHNKYTQQVLVYNFGDLKLLHQIETLSNPRGLVAISSTAESTVLATPGLHTGQVGSRKTPNSVGKRCFPLYSSKHISI